MSAPLVSVVMPVYNGEKYLNEAIDSILNQTFTDFEFIILNDGSTDHSEEIILAYDDARIRYVKNETNLQIVKTLNKGVALAKGQYIARMDADDISLPERLECQVRLMEESPEIDVCGTWIKTFGAQETLWKYPVTHQEIKSRLLFKSPMAHPSVIFRRSLFDKYSYSEGFNKAEDYYLWAQLMDDKELYNLPSPLVMYRLHLSQTDRTIQIDMANKVRKVVLDKIGCNLGNEELNAFLDFTNHSDIGVEISDLIFSKILTANNISECIDQRILTKELGNRYWSILHGHVGEGLKVYYYFLGSAMRKQMAMSKRGYIKLFFKCLIKG
jgi:glycosyltransferase involved in cell wall biosynthesis